MTSVYDFSARLLNGEEVLLSRWRGRVLLIVNTASACGYTPQYAGLEDLYEQFGEDGLTVLGFPCNQFGAQEPGSPDEIETFCSTTYGVTFPMFEKIDVNGENRHPIYDDLTKVADAEGADGDIRWNFEKFLISPAGEIVARYNPMVAPEDPKLVSDIEANLPQG